MNPYRTISDIKVLLTLVAEGVLTDEQFRLAVIQALEQADHRLPEGVDA